VVGRGLDPLEEAQPPLASKIWWTCWDLLQQATNRPLACWSAMKPVGLLAVGPTKSLQAAASCSSTATRALRRGLLKKIPKWPSQIGHYHYFAKTVGSRGHGCHGTVEPWLVHQNRGTVDRGPIQGAG
jgi:hypothetical protein